MLLNGSSEQYPPFIWEYYFNTIFKSQYENFHKYNRHLSYCKVKLLIFLFFGTMSQYLFGFIKNLTEKFSQELLIDWGRTFKIQLCFCISMRFGYFSGLPFSPIKTKKPGFVFSNARLS